MENKNELNLQPKKSKIPVIIGVSVAILAAVSLVAYGIYKNLNKDADSIYAKDAVEVNVAKSFMDTVASVVSVKGSVELSEIVTMYPSNSGVVATMDLKVGDEITQGSTILTYKDDTLKSLEQGLKDANLSIRSAQAGYNAVTTPVEVSDIATADAEIKSAENRVLSAELAVNQSRDLVEQTRRKLTENMADLEKNKILYEMGGLTKADFEKMERGLMDLDDTLKTQAENLDKLEDDLALSKNGVALARTAKEKVLTKNDSAMVKNQKQINQIQIEQAKNTQNKVLEDLDELVLEELAPISGTILELGVEEGATVNQGAPLLKIADLSNDNLIIKSNIPEKDAKDVALGQEVTIKIGDVRDTEYKGVVSKVHPIAEKIQSGSSTYETMVPIEVTILSNDHQLKAGYSVDIEITVRINDEAILVPLTATMIGDNEQFVYIVDEDTFTLKKQVVTPLSYAGNNIEIEGLELGVWVVTSPAVELSEGSPIIPIGGM